MELNVFRIMIFLSSALILVFFISAFTSPLLFLEYWRLIHAFLSDEIRFAIFLSFFTATCSTLIAIIIGVPIAYALSRFEFPGKNLIDAFFDVLVAIPPIALGVILLIFFSQNPLGIFINTRLVRFVFEVPGIILAQFTVICALMIKLLKGAFDGVPTRYEKIARTFGYSELETFIYVTLPAAKRGVFAAALFSWAKALGEFGATVMLAGATRFKTATLPIALYLNLATADLGNVTAIFYILLLISLLTSVGVRRLLTRGFAI